MTVCELYAYLDEKIPASLSCEWDHDGLMCCPDAEKQVRKVLVALDITAAVVETAIAGGYDVILSHHPLIFSPLGALTPNDPVARKVMRLVSADVAAMSFHTRLDAVTGGVNDKLAAMLELCDVRPFGNGGEEIGRVGQLPREMTTAEFAARVKHCLGADQVLLSDAGLPVRRVAVLGGSGSDDVIAAKRAGADTYLSGELKHNWLTDAPELGINLIAAGHFHTENPVCEVLRELVLEAAPTLQVDLVNSNPVKVM